MIVMETLKKLTFLLGLSVSIALTATAQTDKATTAKIVAEKSYTFVATSAFPSNAAEINSILSKMPGATGGGNINLSGSNYDVKITGDSVVAYLPYYGRSYNAPIGNEDSGFKFTSKNFSYTNEKRKKGGWQVAINSKDAKENPRMVLTIAENGYASLVVSSNNKPSISYNGYLVEIGKKD